MNHLAGEKNRNRAMGTADGQDRSKGNRQTTQQLRLYHPHPSQRKSGNDQVCLQLLRQVRGHGCRPWGHYGNHRNDKPQTKAMVLKSILGAVPKAKGIDGREVPD